MQRSKRFAKSTNVVMPSEHYRVRFIAHTCRGRMEIVRVRDSLLHGRIQNFNTGRRAVGRPDLHRVTCGAWSENGTGWEIDVDVARNAYSWQTISPCHSLFLAPKLSRSRREEHLFSTFAIFVKQDISREIQAESRKKVFASQISLFNFA